MQQKQMPPDAVLWQLGSLVDECFHQIGGKTALGFELWYPSALIVVLLDSRDDYSEERIKNAIRMLISRNYADKLDSSFQVFRSLVQAPEVKGQHVCDYIKQITDLLSVKGAKADIEGWELFLSMRQSLRLVSKP